MAGITFRCPEVKSLRTWWQTISGEGEYRYKENEEKMEELKEKMEGPPLAALRETGPVPSSLRGTGGKRKELKSGSSAGGVIGSLRAANYPFTTAHHQHCSRCILFVASTFKISIAWDSLSPCTTLHFPLRWIKTFVEVAGGSMCKTFHLADRQDPPTLTITTDASTSGLGAVLSTPQGGSLAWMPDLIRQKTATCGAEPNDPA